MYNKCCVVSCTSRRKDVNFYRFPKSETGFKKWLQLINCDKLRSLSFPDLRKHFVCKKHFEKRFLASTHARSRLRVGAYPTLFTENEILCGVPQQNIHFAGNEDDAISSDHNYVRKRQHEDHSYSKVGLEPKRSRLDPQPVFVEASTSNIPPQSKENLVAPDLYLSTACESKPAVKPTAHVIELSPKLATHRKCVIFKKNALIPRCNKLYQQFVKSRKQLELIKPGKIKNPLTCIHYGMGHKKNIVQSTLRTM